MNLPNACSFFLIGFVMELIPRFGLTLADTVTPRNSLWLVVMGAVLMTVGAVALGQLAWEARPKLRLLAVRRESGAVSVATSASREDRSVVEMR